MIGMRVKGIEENLAGIHSLIHVVPRAAQRGAIKGSLKILADARKNAPIDKGHLRASGYITWGTGGIAPGKAKGERGRDERGKFTAAKEVDNEDALKAYEESKAEAMRGKNPVGFIVIVGFGAYYALFVHEGEPSNNWNDGGPKFLERSLEDNADHFVNCVTIEVVNAINRRAR